MYINKMNTLPTARLHRVGNEIQTGKWKYACGDKLEFKLKSILPVLQLIVAARPSKHACNIASIAHQHIEEFSSALQRYQCLPQTDQTRPHSCHSCHLPHTLSPIEFCGNWRKVQQTLTKMLLANAGRGWQATCTNEAPASAASRSSNTLEHTLTHTHARHTHPTHTHTHTHSRA